MYQVRIIESVEPLNAESGEPWFRYVIGNEHTTITGYRSGNKKDVHRFANDCITSLNRKYPPVKTRTLNSVQINGSYLSQITQGLHQG